MMFNSCILRIRSFKFVLKKFGVTLYICRLESVASELKLNLVQIIMQSCCPAIPMLPHHSTTHQAPTTPHTGDYVTVLNEGGVAGEWPHPVRRPCVVVEELLNKIISLMMSE